MASGKLSPRQKMINMMYLVLTALLALNVSKEVLNSFFEVNRGIERTTESFTSKNDETYSDFAAAVELNPVKAGPFRDKALEVKKSADEIVEFIKELKHELVLKVDKKVYLGAYLDANGDKIDENSTEKSYSELTPEQKKKDIAYLYNKKNRQAPGELFVFTGKATELKNKINSFKENLLFISDGNEVLASNINSSLNTDDKIGQKGVGDQSWEQYNFEDMPAVGALTLLSKMQSDIRNAEADIIKLLRENIDAGSLKFTSAEAIQIPQSSFILRGDSFRADIFISAKDTTQDPLIFVGEYDSIGLGNYQMVGDYDTVRVVNGKGIFSKKTVREGLQKWGGLIAMKTETGTKTYPFKGSYLVANRTAVVSPVNMNILYLEVDNPLKISVPGFAASEITAVLNNGKLVPTKKSQGEYIARPSKKGKAMVSLFTNIDGKRSKMGEMEFRVKPVPPPKPYVQFTIEAGGSKVIDKMKMVNAGGVLAQLKDFDFKGVRYSVISFRMSGIYKGEQQKAEAKGPKFTSKMEGIIKNSKSGNTITIYDIRAKRTDAKNIEPVGLDPLVLEIK